MAKWVGEPDPVSARRRMDPGHPPKPPAHKDKARWCRGKPGVEHVWKVLVPVNTDGFTIARPCAMAAYYGPDGELIRRWSVFLCKHRIVCASCGRVKRRATQEECKSGVFDPEGGRR